MFDHTRKDFFVTGATRVYGIIGDPVENSLSPLIWNSAFRAEALDSVYIPFKVSESHIEKAIMGLQSLNVCGINVTMPHKNSVARLCSKLNSPADQLQAVNTVRFSRDEIEGWNTDASGFSRLLSQMEMPEIVTVLGSGSSSRAILWALSRQNVKKIFQISRKSVKKPEFINPEIFYENLAWNFGNFAAAISDSGMIINTTPLGWNISDKLPELTQNLTPKKIYIDLNYSRQSNLLQSAKKMGCKIIDGRELLLEQGFESFRLLTGLEPPEKIMRSCLF
ncbi:MAG: shikimate dehydrogenase [Candidatus Rifleibacteriota bacterium]